MTTVTIIEQRCVSLGKQCLPLKSLLKIVVRQFLDDKHGSKLAATVTIDQKYSFKCFHSKLLLELMFFLKKM